MLWDLHTPLHYAARYSNTISVSKFLDQGAVSHRDVNDQTPFMHACSKGNLAIAKLLLKGKEYQRDWTNHDGRTALHLAVDGKNAELVTFCLDTGMTVVLNNKRFSFLDEILACNSKTLGEAVVSHRR